MLKVNNFRTVAGLVIIGLVSIVVVSQVFLAGTTLAIHEPGHIGGGSASGSIGQNPGANTSNGENSGSNAANSATEGAPPEEEVVGTEICGRSDTESDTSQDACDCEDGNLDASNCELIGYIEVGINILTGIAGLAIVGGIMTGGYMYMTARDNPGQTAAGRERVVWALVALLILIFFWGFLQWLVPGGVLDNVTGSQFETPT